MKVRLFFLAPLYFLAACSGPNAEEETATAEAVDRMASDTGAVPEAKIDRTISDQERRNFQSDSESYGFNDSDREFLNEHGVSESEARAMETIRRENGVN